MSIALALTALAAMTVAAILGFALLTARAELAEERTRRAAAEDAIVRVHQELRLEKAIATRAQADVAARVQADSRRVERIDRSIGAQS